MADRAAKLNRTELLMNIGWIGIDAGWMLEWNTLALLCIVPTLWYAALTFRYTDRDMDSLCVTTAMAAWACMSCAWVAHDLDCWPVGKAVATGCLIVCLVALATVGIRSRGAKETARAALERFRRLRLPRP